MIVGQFSALTSHTGVASGVCDANAGKGLSLHQTANVDGGLSLISQRGIGSLPHAPDEEAHGSRPIERRVTDSLKLYLLVVIFGAQGVAQSAKERP